MCLCMLYGVYTVHLSTESLCNWTRWLQKKYKWPYWDWLYILQRLICIGTLLQRLFSSVHYSIEYIDFDVSTKIANDARSLARCKMNFMANICIEFLLLCKSIRHFFTHFIFIIQSLNFKLCVFAVCLFVCIALDFFALFAVLSKAYTNIFGMWTLFASIVWIQFFPHSNLSYIFEWKICSFCLNMQ